MKACSFTGHRIIPKDKETALSDLLDRAIDYAYGEGCRTFYCGGALGFDTMAAKAIIKKRMLKTDMRLIIVIPCADQDAKWNSGEKNMYNYVISSADEVIYTSLSYTKDCMKRRNERLAEMCDILIAFCGNARSGSAQTVRIAKSFGKTVYNLYPKICLE
jgi:uncharacterized phage-like protein YoqJ